MSQPDPYDISLAENLRDSIHKQAEVLQMVSDFESFFLCIYFIIKLINHINCSTVPTTNAFCSH